MALRQALIRLTPRWLQAAAPVPAARAVAPLAAALLAAAVLSAAPPLAAATAPHLDETRSELFRAWFVRIVKDQLKRGPSPRWVHRDCAGLVRFAAKEALRAHDPAWLRASGLRPSDVPPELTLTPAERASFSAFQVGDGAAGAFARAIILIQENSTFVSKDMNQARPGDLLFFDQGEDQHLMVWLDHLVGYHTGTTTPKDDGLRLVSLPKLMQWKDTRWQPTQDNPNFVGLFRFSFLAR